MMYIVQKITLNLFIAMNHNNEIAYSIEYQGLESLDFSSFSLHQQVPEFFRAFPPPGSLDGFGSGVGRIGAGLEVLLGLVGAEDEGLEGGERAHRALELGRLALVLQIIAPHLVELGALGASVAEHQVAAVCLAIGCERQTNKNFKQLVFCFLFLRGQREKTFSRWQEKQKERQREEDRAIWTGWRVKTVQRKTGLIALEDESTIKKLWLLLHT